MRVSTDRISVTGCLEEYASRWADKSILVSGGHSLCGRAFASDIAALVRALRCQYGVLAGR